MTELAQSFQCMTELAQSCQYNHLVRIATIATMLRNRALMKSSVCEKYCRCIFLNGANIADNFTARVIIIIIIRHTRRRGRAGLHISRRLCFAPSSTQSAIQGLQFSGHLLLFSAMCYGVRLADASIRGGVCAWRLACPTII